MRRGALAAVPTTVLAANFGDFGAGLEKITRLAGCAVLCRRAGRAVLGAFLAEVYIYGDVVEIACIALTERWCPVRIIV